MKKHIIIIAGFCAAVLTLASCSDEFLEVKNPTGEPLEEYYTTEETLNEALTSAYAPLHWPDWDLGRYGLQRSYGRRRDYGRRLLGRRCQCHRQRALAQALQFRGQRQSDIGYPLGRLL